MNTRMAQIDTLKKRILQEAVRENVALIEGRPKVVADGRRRRGRTILSSLALLSAGVLLFVSINAISTGGSGGPEVVVVPPRPAPAQEPSLESLPWPRPRLIDPTVFRLAVRTVVIDPGHGGHDPGAEGASGLAEKQVTLDVALRLAALLEKSGLRAILTRSTDTSVSLRDRAQLARESGGDVLLSIHVNSIPGARRGVETYVLGPTDDPRVRELASAENRASGYSLSDFRNLLEGVYVGVRQSESQKLAASVQKELVRSLGLLSPGGEDRGVKSAPLVVLIASEMPAVLTEVSCISSEEEARRLADPGYRQGIAESLLRGVTAYAEAQGRGADGRKGDG